jgi:hypothetical protein
MEMRRKNIFTRSHFGEKRENLRDDYKINIPVFSDISQY